MQLAPGSRFGGFEIRSPLGRGGMASVWRARELALDRDVALKVLPADLVAQPGFADRFEREARALAKLDHEHVVPLLAFGIEGGVPWMSMRLLEGGSLDAELRNGRMAPPRLFAVLAGVAEALAAAHARGLVHRDVKPGNILLDARGKAYLSDFGIAKGHGEALDLTGSGVIGTPRYASPEQAMGLAVDGRSDVYSLGVVAFEALAGRAPFEGPSAFSVLKQHVEETPPLALLPEAARASVGRALAKDPTLRWGGAPEFVAALGAAMAGEAASDTMTTPLHRGIVRYSPGAFVARMRERKVVQWTLAYAGVAWALLQAVDFVGARFGWPPDVGRGLIVAFGWGLPLVATLAWFHGERGVQRVTRPELAVLALIAAGAVASFAGLPHAPGRPAPATAGSGELVVFVAPADVAGEAAETASYGTGMREKLVIALDRMPRIRPVVDPLGATHDLRLVFRSEEGRIRTTVTLGDAADARVIWRRSDAVRGPFVVELQSGHASGLARAVRIVLETRQRHAGAAAPTASARALELYAQARGEFVYGGYEDALQRLDGALALDPGFVQAHALVAVIGAITGTSSGETRVAQPDVRARAALDAARRLQPGLPETLVASGWVRAFLDRDAEGALADFAQAEPLAPDHPDLLRGKAFALTFAGRSADALATFERLVVADPLDEWAVANIGMLLIELRRYRDAVRFLDAQAVVFPRWPQFDTWRMRAQFLFDADADRLAKAIDPLKAKFGFAEDQAIVFTMRVQAAVLLGDIETVLRLLEGRPPGPLPDTGYPHLISSPSESGSLRALLSHVAGKPGAKERVADELAMLERMRAQQPDALPLDISAAWLGALAGAPPADSTLASFAARIEAMPANRAQERGPTWTALAVACTWSGDLDGAFAAIERALQEPFGLHAAQLARDPVWTPLRGDPRYARVLAGHGFAFAAPKPASR